MKKEKILCCYCGINEATTKDHIPPKSIFNKPKPSDLITVPCCFDCNHAASVNDEKFKTYLGMHIARYGGEHEILFKDGVLRTMRHNRKLYHQIMKSLYPVLTTTESGIITGKAAAAPWDNKVHDTTTERIVRGLFYHHYKKILPIDIPVKIYFFSKAPFIEYEGLDYNSFANGNFEYFHVKAEDTDYGSFWLFSFYKGAHLSGAIINNFPTTPT